MSTHDVHTCLTKIRPFRIQKHIKDLPLDGLIWKDGTPLCAEEYTRLITVLRAQDFNQHRHPFTADILAHLDPEGTHTFGVRLLERWEELDFPSQHKWMLFQLRDMAKKEAVVALGTRHDLIEMSSRFWARASWYLEVIADVGPSKPSDALFLKLLDRGPVDGTLQHFARDAFWRFAAHLGMDDPNDYLEARGLIDSRPTASTPTDSHDTLVDTLEATFSARSGMDLLDRLRQIGYRVVPDRDGGRARTHFKTCRADNVRVFLDYTITSSARPARFEQLRFCDLFGRPLDTTKIPTTLYDKLSNELNS